MSDNVKINITGTNNASPAFKQVAADAQAMGNTVEQAGQRSSRSFDDFNRRAAALGAAIGTTAGVLADWTRAAAEDQAEQARLQTAIEATGKSYDLLSTSVDKAIAIGQKKAFSDTQVRDALVALTTATGDAQTALADLGVVEDFARLKNIDLGTAAEVVGKILDGNTGIASRYGIQIDKNATATEALAAIQAKSAGQADAYAQSNAGWLAEQKIRIDELTESWGYQAGAISKVLGLMPGLSAAYTGIAGIIGGLGGGAGLLGAGSLAVTAAGYGALGTIAYGYAKDDVGTTFANELANKIFLIMSQMINVAVPGSPFDTQKYVDQMAKNSTWDQILGAFGSPDAAGKALGVQGTPIYGDTTFGTGGGSGENAGNIGYDVPNGPGTTQGTVITGYQQPTQDQVYAAIVAAAASGNMTVAQYLATPAVRKAAMIATAIPGTGYGGVYTSGYGSLAGAPAATTGPYGANGFDWWRSHSGVSGMYGQGPGGGAQTMVYHAGGSGAVANDISGQVAMGGGVRPVLTDDQQAAQRHAAIAQALGVENAAYVDLASGITTAASAQAAFKATQDGVLQSETVYSQQISEYSGQVDAITKAHDLLNQKVAEGIPLTKQQQEFQDNYNEALARGTGAVDDATISQGILAEQYLLNMEKGDQLNQTMATQSAATGELVGVIQELILSLSGVPSDVVTQIRLDMSQADPTNLALYVAYLNSIPSSVSTVIESVYVTSGTPVGGGAGGAGQAYNPARLGGVVGYARGGVVIGAGEAGPEMFTFPNGGTGVAMTSGLYSVPRGTYVDTAPATKQKMGGGVSIAHAEFHFSGFQSADDVRRQINEFALGGAR